MREKPPALAGFILGVCHSLGRGLFYDPRFGPTGINVVQMWASREGMARVNVQRGDVIHPTFDRGVQLIYPTTLDAPLIMPDGSIIPHCYWTFMNDRKRARIGIYPEMPLSEIEAAASSKRTILLKAASNIATYPLALLRIR